MIDNFNVERVHENRFLRVILDPKLCWKPQINYLRTKLAKNVLFRGKQDTQFCVLLFYCLNLNYAQKFVTLKATCNYHYADYKKSTQKIIGHPLLSKEDLRLRDQNTPRTLASGPD